MKRTPLWIGIVVACMVATGTPEALGQPVQFGGFVELGWSKLEGDPEDVIRNATLDVGDRTRVRGLLSGGAGITGIVPLRDWVAVEPHLALETRGVAVEKDLPEFGFFSAWETYRGTYEATYVTLAVPVSVRLHLGGGWALRALAGPWTSVRVRSTWRRTEDSDGYSPIPDRNPMDIRPYDVGGRFGLGVSTNSMLLLVDGRFVFDFVLDTGTYDVGTDRMSLRSRSMRLSIGYVVEQWDVR